MTSQTLIFSFIELKFDFAPQGSVTEMFSKALNFSREKDIFFSCDRKSARLSVVL